MGWLTKQVYRACAHFGFSTPRQLRMYWLMIFRHTYFVQKQLTRKGKCTNAECATVCCGKCEWLIEKDGKWLCKDYANAPIECHIYPVDEKVLEIRNKQCKELGLPECGLYWGKLKVKEDNEL